MNSADIKISYNTGGNCNYLTVYMNSADIKISYNTGGNCNYLTVYMNSADIKIRYNTGGNPAAPVSHHKACDLARHHCRSTLLSRC